MYLKVKAVVQMLSLHTAACPITTQVPLRVHHPTQTQIFECAGLGFQQTITETKIRINNGVAQRYRNRDYLTEYLSCLIGNNVKEVSDGYNWYTADGIMNTGNQFRTLQEHKHAPYTSIDPANAVSYTHLTLPTNREV